MDKRVKPPAKTEAPKTDSAASQNTKAVAIKISGIVLNTAGVACITKRTDETSKKKAAEKKPAKGIRISKKNDSVQVDIHIAVEFGVSVTSIARQIQKETSALFAREYPQLRLYAVNVWVDEFSYRAGAPRPEPTQQ